MKIQNLKMRFLLLILTLCFSVLAAVAQPTNGIYNMQFAVFNAVSGGNQTGSTAGGIRQIIFAAPGFAVIFPK